MYNLPLEKKIRFIITWEELDDLPANFLIQILTNLITKQII